jgi:tetratricopeptide (TPR) repeat protein
MLFRLESFVTLAPVWVWLFCSFGSAFASTEEAERLLRHGAVNEALTAATAAARTTPRDLGAQELYVDLLVATGMGARALREVRELAQADPANPAAHYLVGRVLPDAAQAQSAYEAALRLDPNFPRAHMGMGALHEARGQLPQAEAAYSRATKGDATLSEAWLGRVRMLLRQSRQPEALAAAREGLAACPTEPALALVVAQLVPAEAEKVIAEGLRRVPDEPRLHEAQARLLLAKGDAKGALAAARAALAIDPSAVEASLVAMYAAEIADGRLDLAGKAALEAARAQEGLDPKGAVARYPALVAKYPRSALIRLGLAAAREAAKDPGALDDLLEAVALDPGNMEAAGAAGLALLETNRAIEAEPLLAQAAAARPWDSSLGLARARALAASGRSTEAARLTAEMAKRFRFDAGVQLAHAGFLVDQGKAAEAYQVLRTALMVVPDPRLAAAFVRVAPLAGYPEEAAAMLDQIVAQTGNQALAEAARKLRESPRR